MRAEFEHCRFRRRLWPLGEEITARQGEAMGVLGNRERVGGAVGRKERRRNGEPGEGGERGGRYGERERGMESEGRGRERGKGERG